MTKKPLLFLALLLQSFSAIAQEINTDEVYFRALEEYRKGNYELSLDLTNTGLQAAPGYHDIRILRVRNNFALKNFDSTDEDLAYLLKEAPGYEGVKTISLQRLHQMPFNRAITFSNRLLEIYPWEPEILIQKAEILLKQGEHQQARELVMEAYDSEALIDGQRYNLHRLLNLTVKNAVQFTGQLVDFSEDYTRNDSWYAISAEYQHNFSNLAVIGRATYADRSYNSGSLYELEAYPVISDKVYAFGNIGYSNGRIFPDLRASASVFYNFAPSFEVEGGFRSLFYNQSGYLTGIIGLTGYTGRFYLNGRAFLGPERHEQLLQNYQFNIRYYLNTPENYLFARLGSGFSPDEPTLYTRTQENPTLKALFFNAGINKTLGIHHVISAGAGILAEDLSRNEQGTQLTASLGYRYKF